MSSSHTKYNPYFRQSLKLFAVTDFIAELTQHLPPKGVHYIRRAVLVAYTFYLEALSPPPAPFAAFQGAT